MSETRYSEVLFPDRPRILGFDLVAPTLGHYLVLLRCKSLPVKAEVGTLCNLIYVLSRPWQRAARGVNSRLIRWRFKLWALQMRALSDDALREIAWKIAEHLDHSWEGPEVWEGLEEGDHQCASPYVQVLKVRLMHLFGLTADQALSVPIRTAIFDTACWAEDHGRVELVSDELGGLIDKALAAAEAIEKEKANG
jgi:hypothetical protein